MEPTQENKVGPPPLPKPKTSYLSTILVAGGIFLLGLTGFAMVYWLTQKNVSLRNALLIVLGALSFIAAFFGLLFYSIRSKKQGLILAVSIIGGGLIGIFAVVFMIWSLCGGGF
jgi:hypothetical protein